MEMSLNYQVTPLKIYFKGVLFFLLIYIWKGVSAEITVDGSLGSDVSFIDSNYQINGGTQVGGNLFHSFDIFNINKGEKATFSGNGTNGGITNIMARVTGGSPSFINGQLRSTIPGANLFFLNPAGIMFGASATLDVQGAFYVSTADYIRLDDGVRFDVKPSFSDSLLTIAQPEMFGFLNREEAVNIKIEQSFLINFDDLSIIGGNIEITEGSTLTSVFGTLKLVSIASEGEINFKDNQFDNDTDLKLGDIDLGGLPITPSFSFPNINAGNQVVIRGGNLVLENAIVKSNSVIDVQVADDLLMQNENAKITIEEQGGIVNINAKKIELSNGAEISSINTVDSEQRNKIIITAKNLTLNSVSTSPTSSKISRIFAKGNSEITLNIDHLKAIEGGRINTEGGGNIIINAKSILLDGVKKETRAGILSSTSTLGDSGNISLSTEHLSVQNGATITTSTNPLTLGSGGDLDIKASKQILLDGVGGKDGGFKSSIRAETQGRKLQSGDGGKLTIHTNNLLIQNQALISARTRGSGNAGNVEIDANSINMQNQGSISSASESIGSNAGKAGTISIDANDILILSEKSEITVATEQAAAGNIDISTGLLALKDQSSITTSVAGGAGDGGNIKLSPTLLIINDASKIIANAQQGNAGNIDIQIQNGGTLFESLDSVIEASSQFGINGNVEINAPDVDITSGFKPLPGNYLDVATVLQKPCAQRFHGNTIQFVNRKYQVLPDSPYALRTISYGQPNKTRLTPSLFPIEEPFIISKKKLRLSDCLG